MRISAGFAISIAWAGAAAAQQGPLSAIDWLSDSLAAPLAIPAPPVGVPGSGIEGAPTSEITVSTIDETERVAVGLLPASVSGLPRDLWGNAAPEDIAALLADLSPTILPALRDQLFTLLLAELDPPAGGDPSDALFLARLDTLLRFGAVDDTIALVERSGTSSPDVFRRYFDAALLSGAETEACTRLTDAPDLAPSFPARIFCLARDGDWETAALTLGTGEAIGVIDEAEAELLTRFLDPEHDAEGGLLPPPRRPTPLELKLYEAIGEALSTTAMPLAYANLDLSDQTGWRQQLEAAERLVASGALEPNLLLGLYTERSPAASGGLWDRVAAIQSLDAALSADDDAALARALPEAWAAMADVGLETALAALYADRLIGKDLTGQAAEVATHLKLLGPRYEAAALQSGDIDPVLAAIATGRPEGATPGDPRARAILMGFSASGIPDRYADLMDKGHLGSAILQALAHFERGANGELAELTDATAFLRAVGLHDTARRASLQALLLDHPG